MSTFTRLRSWTIRTFYKGMRERWPLRWWWRFARQVWRERRNVAYSFHRMHFDLDLLVRRQARIYGERGGIVSMGRVHNATMKRLLDDTRCRIETLVRVQELTD